MSFLYPYVLCALLLPLLLAAALVLLSRRNSRGWRRLVSAAHENELVTRRPAWRTVLPAALCLSALVCGILALARPINGYRESGGTASGRNLLLALDISRSMETQDVQPNRLQEARAAAYELIESLPNDKIGLIVFSGTADLVVPLTYDHTALRDALEQVNRGWAGSGGTNFSLVLKKAMQDFKRSAPDGTNALVILSDGEDTTDKKGDIEAEAKENHLMVITVGIGTAAGGPIPDAQGENGLWQDAEGKHVISKLDAASLQAFAQATGGSYFHMGQHADLTEFARQAVRKLDRHEEEFSLNKVPNDLFAYFAAAALLLVVAAVLLATNWRRPQLPLASLLLLPLLTPAWGAQAESVAAYRAGLAAMGQDAAKAKEAFSQALLDEDTHLQAACQYELGNIAAAATFNELRALYEGEENGTPKQPTADDLQKIVDKLKTNEQPYKDALAADAALHAAQRNIDKIEELIKKLEEEIERLKQQQQNEQQQNQDNQQNQENQDQQDDQQQNQGQNDGQGDKKGDKPNNDQQQQDGDRNQDNDRQDESGNDKQDEQQNDKQDGQDKQDEQQGDRPNEQQNEQQGEQEQNKGQQPQEQERNQQAEQEQPAGLSDKEKAEQKAASILQMHVEEEHGSPIPHFNDNPTPPKKDY